MDWSPYYPAFVDPNVKDNNEGQPKPLTKSMTIADIGCGFGGLLVALSPLLPDELILGLEIRTQVTEYVQDRISALRSQHTFPIPTGKIPKKPANTPISATSKPPESKEYVIYPKDGHNEAQLAVTEASIKRITNVDSVYSYRDFESALLHWVIDLTEVQLEEVQQLDGIAEIEENVQCMAPQRHLKSSSTRITDIENSLEPTIDIDNSMSDSPAQAPYQNISVLRANTMKFLPNFFTRGQLSTIFLCFPDPHFKARKHKARIVSSTLCAEYAYVLRPGGCVYTITDVEELGEWMRERFDAFGKDDGGEGLFESVEVPKEGEEREWEGKGGEGGRVGMLVRCIREETEEGKKVTRNGGKKFLRVWRRRGDPGWPGED